MKWPDFDWSTIGNLVAGLAPSIAGALAGPFGPVASIAVTALMKAVGLGDDATPDELQAALLSGNPELLAQIRKADQDFALELERLGIQLEEVHARDRDSARRREADVKDRTPSVLAALVTIGFFALCGLMAFHAPPVENKDVLILLLGALSGAFATVLAYYFGSSSGSKLKTDALASIAGKNGVPRP